MAGTEGGYLGDDKIFLFFFLNLEVVGEIGGGELERTEMSHLEQRFPRFCSYTSRVWVGVRGWDTGLRQHNTTSTGWLLRGERCPLQAP